MLLGCYDYTNVPEVFRSGEINYLIFLFSLHLLLSSSSSSFLLPLLIIIMAVEALGVGSRCGKCVFCGLP